MRASVSIKATTDPFGGLATAALWPELELIHLVNPTVDADPNAGTPLSPNDPRVVQWPNFAYWLNGNGLVGILGGTNLTGRFWYYEPALSKWFIGGNGAAGIALVTGALQGQVAVTMHASKPTYWQTTVVVGAVTDLFYGVV